MKASTNKRNRKKRVKLSTAKERLDKATNYEEIVKRIYELLTPKAAIVHDDKIYGKDSEMERQIDVSIRSNIAGHEILIIVNCKDQQRKATVNQVGELHSVMQDVKAHMGVLICNSGFTDGAKKIAKNRGIELCSIHDAETKDWRLILKYPVICEKININAGFEFEYPVDESGNINLIDFHKFKDSMIEGFNSRWGSGKIPLDKDNLVYEFPSPLAQMIDVNSQIKCTIQITRDFYFGYIDQLPKAKAIRNETTGKAELLISPNDFSQIEELNFLKMKNLAEAPVPIVDHIRCLMIPRVSFPEDGKILITGVRL